MAAPASTNAASLPANLLFGAGGISGRFIYFEQWAADGDYPIDTILEHDGHLWWASVAPPVGGEPGTHAAWHNLTATAREGAGSFFAPATYNDSESRLELMVSGLSGLPTIGTVFYLLTPASIPRTEPPAMLELGVNGSTNLPFEDAMGNQLDTNQVGPNTIYEAIFATTGYRVVNNVPRRPQDYDIKAAVSPDQTLEQAEIDAGTTSATPTITIPTFTTNSYIYFGVPTNTPDISDLIRQGISNIGGFERATPATQDGYKWWVSVSPKNQLASGDTYTVIQ